MTPFSYKSKRTFNTPEGEITLDTLEGFFIESVVDWAIGKTPNDETEQLIVRLTNQEDKDVVRQFPIMGAKGVVKSVENRLVRRNENTMIVITDENAIQIWKDSYSK
jgi:hypothetical protein